LAFALWRAALLAMLVLLVARHVVVVLLLLGDCYGDVVVVAGEIQGAWRKLLLPAQRFQTCKQQHSKLRLELFCHCLKTGTVGTHSRHTHIEAWSAVCPLCKTPLSDGGASDCTDVYGAQLPSTPARYAQ
jgi:hypothetical protein